MIVRPEDIAAQVSQELGIPKSTVLGVYKNVWEFIRLKISNMPLKDSEELPEGLRTSFSIIGLGHLHTHSERVKRIKERYKRTGGYDKNKRH